MQLAAVFQILHHQKTLNRQLTLTKIVKSEIYLRVLKVALWGFLVSWLVPLAVFVQLTKQRRIIAFVYAAIFLIHLNLADVIILKSVELYIVFSALIDLLILTLILSLTNINKMVYRISIITLISLCVNVGGLVTYLLNVQSLYYNNICLALSSVMILALIWRNNDDMAGDNSGLSFNGNYGAHFNSWFNYIRENKAKT